MSLPQVIEVCARNDQEIVPAVTEVKREYIMQLGRMGLLQLDHRYAVLSIPTCYPAAVAGLDLNSRQFPVAILNDKDVVSTINFRNGGIVTAVKEDCHYGQVPAPPGIQ